MKTRPGLASKEPLFLGLLKMVVRPLVETTVVLAAVKVVVVRIVGTFALVVVVKILVHAPAPR